jgi:hypothetical protein
MKAILEFNLYEEREQFEDAINGGKWQHTVWQLDQYLRTKTKYAPDDMPADVYTTFEIVRDELHRIIEQNELTLK